METKESPMSLPNFITVKTREIFNKKEIAVNNHFIYTYLNLATSITESKTTFQTYIHYDGPCLSTINLTDIELEDVFENLKTSRSSGYDDIFADVVKRVSNKIFFLSEICSQYLFSKGNLPR